MLYVFKTKCYKVLPPRLTPFFFFSFLDELKPYYNQNKRLTTLQKLYHHYIKAKALHAENSNTKQQELTDPQNLQQLKLSYSKIKGSI
jgi:hypothetical protein